MQTNKPKANRRVGRKRNNRKKKEILTKGKLKEANAIIGKIGGLQTDNWHNDYRGGSMLTQDAFLAQARGMKYDLKDKNKEFKNRSGKYKGQNVGKGHYVSRGMTEKS
jgi:hypothetical protein